MTGNNTATILHLILILNLGSPKSDTGNLITLLINIFKRKYDNPAYITPAIILQIPYGTCIIVNMLAIACAITCVITKMNMATNDMPIAFFCTHFISPCIMYYKSTNSDLPLSGYHTNELLYIFSH